jgi:hypothetical protein
MDGTIKLELEFDNFEVGGLDGLNCVVTLYNMLKDFDQERDAEDEISAVELRSFSTILQVLKENYDRYNDARESLDGKRYFWKLESVE